MRTRTQRRQRTLKRSVEVSGIGYLTGRTVRLRFVPAPPDTGIVLVRTDLRPAVAVPAHVDAVTGTARRTTLGRAPAEIGLVEHVLAALAGMRIDNCRLELDAPEPPGLDGSARAFVDAVVSAGVVVQAAWKPVCVVDEPVTVRHDESVLTVHPLQPGEEGLRVSYFLDYGPYAQPMRQSHTQSITPARFREDLCGARTFLLEGEVAALRNQGIGRASTTKDLLIFGPHGPIDNDVHHADEPARHKVLDIVGDLALLGVDLWGHVVGHRSGHAQNVELARVLNRARTGSALAA